MIGVIFQLVKYYNSARWYHSTDEQSGKARVGLMFSWGIVHTNWLAIVTIFIGGIPSNQPGLWHVQMLMLQRFQQQIHAWFFHLLHLAILL